jgi:hypothetical protein
MEEKVNKIFNLIENYNKSLKTVSDKLPAMNDAFDTKPEEYFIIAEIVEEIINIDVQLYEKFENIIDLCMEEIKVDKNYVVKKSAKMLGDAIQKFKECRAKSNHIREKAIIHLSQIETPDFTMRKDKFTPEQKKEINFAEETLKNYHKKLNTPKKLYDRCLAKASKLYGIAEGLL